MHGAIVAILMVVGVPADTSTNPSALVAQLGSSRFADREAAELALARLGRVALPALHSAESNLDPEIRTRAVLILEKIEGRLLVEPTRIGLDFQDVRLVDALTAINQQAGLRFKLTPEVPLLWADRRISVRTTESLAYWKAIDKLCQAGSLHYVFGGQNDFDQGESSVALFDGFAASQGVFDDQGPFRIQLASLQYQSEVHLTAERTEDRAVQGEVTTPVNSGRTQSLTSRQFFLQMLVGAEPRLSISPAGAIKLVEAIDDRGQSLMIPARGETLQHESGYLGVNPSPLVHLRLDLAYPGNGSTRLKRIKGSIPLMVSTRKPDPLEIPLAGATGKTFRQNGTSVVVGEIRLQQADQSPTIELAIKPDRGSLNAVDDDPDDEVRVVASPQQLEILDAGGRMIPWFPSSSFFNGEEAKLTLTLLDRGATMVPTLIRYHGVIRDRTEVPFEFRDLPLP